MDGFQVHEKSTREALAVVTNRASFELSCPAEQLKPRILNAQSRGGWVTSIGITGCDHRLVYVLTSTGWVLNSDSGAAPAATPAAAPVATE